MERGIRGGEARKATTALRVIQIDRPRHPERNAFSRTGNPTVYPPFDVESRIDHTLLNQSVSISGPWIQHERPVRVTAHLDRLGLGIDLP